MKTKTITLYEYDELPDNVKSKVLDELRYINVEDSFWHDYDGKTGFTLAELKRMKVEVKDAPDNLIKYKNIYFDLDARYIQFTDAKFSNDEVARKFLRVPGKLWDNVHWTFVNKGFGGNRHNSTVIEYEPQYYDKEFTPKQVEILDRAAEIFSEKMEEALRNLRNQYEYLVTDEAIIETIEANGYTFTITGKIENA